MEEHVSNAGDTSLILDLGRSPGDLLEMATHSSVLAESGASQSSIQETESE